MKIHTFTLLKKLLMKDVHWEKCSRSQFNLMDLQLLFPLTFLLILLIIPPCMPKPTCMTTRSSLSQDAALASLKSLNKGDVVEVRALQRPPLGVKIVIEAVSIMKEIKPKKVCMCMYTCQPKSVLITPSGLSLYQPHTVGPVLTV